ncbi:MAG: metal-dependent transcriptional regulator [Clostridiales Family XIII bacterium]|jgi:Mn-dependent DtxR family transcriptional regulator|nr:metal-dependent transcriptional regulator [Clostridiales Family XIII bacterium]
MEKLSFTLESYLDAVYELSREKEGTRLTDVARRMNVTKSTANAAMASLAKKRLIESERYQSIRLTESGAAMARGVTRKHETIRRFFCECLKMDGEAADADACAIEHVISDAAVRAMRECLEEPRREGSPAPEGVWFAEI